MYLLFARMLTSALCLGVICSVGVGDRNSSGERFLMANSKTIETIYKLIKTKKEIKIMYHNIIHFSILISCDTQESKILISFMNYNHLHF